MAPLLLTLLMVSPALLATVGIWLLTFSGLQGVGAVVQSLRRRWSGQRFDWLYDDAGATVTVGAHRWTFSWAMLLPLFGGLGLAVLWHQPALSVWSILLGFAASVLIYLSEAPATAEERALEEVFLAAFRSRYSVSHSLGATLRGAAEDIAVDKEHHLSRVVQQTVQRLYAGEELEKALQPLAAHSPLLRRLARILERSNLAARDETQVLLEALEDLARQNRRLAEQAHVTLTVVRLTLRILTVANATIIIAAALLPTWRRHYVAQPGTYVLGSGIALVGYGYFRFKIKHLQEQL
jgi:Flp pilus assembly protein TadB